MTSRGHSDESSNDHEHDCRCCDHEHGEQDEQGHDHCGCDHERGNNGIVTLSLAISGILVGAGLLLHGFQIGPAMLHLGIFVSAIFIGGWMLLPGAWKAVRQVRPNITLLMVIAVLGASVIGEWAEAATVVFLFGVAEWLEGWADRRARRAVEALLEIAPKTATVLRDGRRVSPAGACLRAAGRTTKSSPTAAKGRSRNRSVSAGVVNLSARAEKHRRQPASGRCGVSPLEWGGRDEDSYAGMISVRQNDWGFHHIR